MTSPTSGLEADGTTSDKNRECKGQGIDNLASGVLGGMAGCAMIGQSIINVKSGGRTRLSTLCAGVFLLLMVVFLGEWLSRIPMAALVAVMIMVSIGTFSWDSLRNLKQHPLSTNLVMVATVVVVVATHSAVLVHQIPHVVAHTSNAQRFCINGASRRGRGIESVSDIDAWEAAQNLREPRIAAWRHLALCITQWFQVRSGEQKTGPCIQGRPFPVLSGTH